MRPLLPLTLLALLPATPAFAAHWQYGPSTHVDTRTGHEYPARDGGNAHAERWFVDEAHRTNAQEIAMAEVALRGSRDEEVRRFAERMIDFSRRFDEDLGFRGAGAGFTDAGGLDRLRGAELDVAYLSAAMDAHDRIRPAFADYKERSGGRLHSLLREDWDELVSLREWAKPLHDEIRNDARDRGRDDRDRDGHWRYPNG